jgi:hypothetical protein
MAVTVKNRKFIFQKSTADILKYPNECPMCHANIHIEPYFNEGNIRNYNNEIDSLNNDSIQLIFRCPKCFTLFVSTFSVHYNAGDSYWLDGSYPQIPQKLEFEDEIRALSPLFVETYEQSNTAEARKLDQIAGCGYRRSLEFLIKDYCIDFLKMDA